MRLLLTHGYFLGEDAKEQQIMRPYPPLGILYLSAYLRSRGFPVDVYDSTFGSRQELLNALQDGEPGLLGIYTNLITRPACVEIIGCARELGWRIVAGGPEAANYAAEYLQAGATWVVPGEGELVLEALLRGDPSPNGVVYREGDAVVRTPPMQQVHDLDSLPWPDRERIDLYRYLSVCKGRSEAGEKDERKKPEAHLWREGVYEAPGP